MTTDQTPDQTTISTPADANYKEREVRVQENELTLKQAQFDYERNKGPLANVAVSVTVIASAAALVFQTLGYFASREDREAANIRLQTSEKRAGMDWDYKGLELFVTGEDKIVGCDPAATDAQVSLFSNLFPNLMSQIRIAASVKAQTCATAHANAAATSASIGKATPQLIKEAADKARYATMSSYASALAQPAAATMGPRTIYIQIANESQRGVALNLQQVLIAKGYSCPGIQLVSAAPRSAQLRVYRKDELSAASAITAIIGVTLQSPPPSAISIEKTFKNLPSGVAEFWFPAVF